MDEETAGSRAHRDRVSEKRNLINHKQARKTLEARVGKTGEAGELIAQFEHMERREGKQKELSTRSVRKSGHMMRPKVDRRLKERNSKFQQQGCDFFKIPLLSTTMCQPCKGQTKALFSIHQTK